MAICTLLILADVQCVRMTLATWDPENLSRSVRFLAAESIGGAVLLWLFIAVGVRMLSARFTARTPFGLPGQLRRLFLSVWP